MLCTAKVVKNICIAKDIHEIQLLCNVDIPKILPGQFVHIAVQDCFLRRPISIATYSNNIITILVQNVGKGSELLCDLLPSQHINMLCPLGNGFNMKEVVDTIQNKGRVWLVGGGIGLAPLFFCAQYIKALSLKVDVFLGYRDDAHAFYINEFSDCSTVISNIGGFVTDAVSKSLESGNIPDLILSCGPSPLLSSLKAICVKHKIKAYASLEARMGCGVGACLVCNAKIANNDGYSYKRVCKDGPVFNLLEVEL